MRRDQRWFACVFCTLALTWSLLTDCRADTIEIENGDRLSGHIVRLNGGKIVIATVYAGEISIDLGKVRALATEQVMTVEVTRTRRIYGYISGTGKQLQ